MPWDIPLGAALLAFFIWISASTINSLINILLDRIFPRPVNGVKTAIENLKDRVDKIEAKVFK